MFCFATWIVNQSVNPGLYKPDCMFNFHFACHNIKGPFGPFYT